MSYIETLVGFGVGVFSGSCEICCKSKNAAHENGILACCSEYSHTERPCLNHKKIIVKSSVCLKVSLRQNGRALKTPRT